MEVDYHIEPSSRLKKRLKRLYHSNRMERKRGRFVRTITRPPFNEERGEKGWFRHLSRAQPHVLRHLRLAISGWPCWTRPLRIAFLSDFHTGSHANDVERLRSIIADVNRHEPDIALFGGDYVNLQPIGGGRVPPRTIAAELSLLAAPLGRFAVLGNHDYLYGQDEVESALREHGTAVLDHSLSSVAFEGAEIDIAGIPDGDVRRAEGYALLQSLQLERPTIVLAHDPVWFKDVPLGPLLTLAGHTHGGQIQVPGIGIVKRGSRARRAWCYGLTALGDGRLYVTSGIGTSLVPLRRGVPPEFAIIDVIGAAQQTP